MSDEMPEIETGIELPKYHTRNWRWVDLLNKMSVGDSVVLSKEEARRFSTTVQTNHKRWRIRTARQEDGCYRCWKRGNKRKRYE